MAIVTDDVTVQYIVAGDLEQGDTIVNVGTVLAVGRVGVFVVAQVLTQRPSLATGTIESVLTDYVRHQSDNIVISV